MNNLVKFVWLCSLSTILKTSTAVAGDVWATAAPNKNTIVLREADGGNFIAEMFSENGTLNPAFGNQGIAEVRIPYKGKTWISDIKTTSDGIIYISGNFTQGEKLDTIVHFFTAKLSLDGRLVFDFGHGGVLVFNTSYEQNDTVHSLCATRDGGFVVVSENYSAPIPREVRRSLKRLGPLFEEHTGKHCLWKFNKNGELDANFGNGGLASLSLTGLYPKAAFFDVQSLIELGSGDLVVSGLQAVIKNKMDGGKTTSDALFATRVSSTGVEMHPLFDNFIFLKKPRLNYATGNTFFVAEHNEGSDRIELSEYKIRADKNLDIGSRELIVLQEFQSLLMSSALRNMSIDLTSGETVLLSRSTTEPHTIVATRWIDMINSQKTVQLKSNPADSCGQSFAQ